jgi:hypothetical protein
MKFKVYIIKKQQLIWAAIVLAIILLAAVLMITLRTRQTIDTIGPAHAIKTDVNGDGKMDSIVVKSDEKTEKYSVDVVASDGNGYALEPDPVIKSLGYNVSWWPMYVDAKDLDKDGDSEVILQSADGNGPILHIFKYNNGKMERMASGRYSIFGTLKNPEHNDGIIVLGYKKDDNVNLTYLTHSSGRLVPYKPEASFNLGKSTFASLVSYIDKKDVEAANVNMESKFASTVAKGSYLDATLVSAKYKKYDIPVECVYQIRTNSGESNDKNIVSYKVKMSLTKYDVENPDYKITNIDITD